jgi:hypothetical protein
MPPPPSWMPDIRILFYADFSGMNLLPVSPGGHLRGQEEEFGLRILKDILEANVSPAISVDLVNRFWTLDSNGGVMMDAPANTASPAKLTPARLRNYDEIWFFGHHLGNFNDEPSYKFRLGPPDKFVPNADFPDPNGYERSELEPDEVAALTDWMNTNGGGVLILGDHSNRPSYDYGGYKTTDLLNLGRAMGSKVPRAGQMRVWNGPPDGYSAVINTSGDVEDMKSMPKQEDSVPQDIFPIQYLTNIAYWHPLFVGSMDLDGFPAIIRVMPDHGHEGKLDLPTAFDASVWPSANGFQPRPEVVAYGETKPTPSATAQIQFGSGGERIPLISAYDGHLASVGRIVAHTTWHHYVNVNLHGFINADGSYNGALQSISEYYRNVASWLMPLAQRTKSLHGALQWLPTVLRDLNGAPFELLGVAALKALGCYATGGQIQDLIFHGVEQVVPPTKERRTVELPLPSLAYLLGGLVTEQQLSPRGDSRDVIVSGIKRALRTRVKELEGSAKALHDLLKGQG